MSRQAVALTVVVLAALVLVLVVVASRPPTEVAQSPTPTATTTATASPAPTPTTTAAPTTAPPTTTAPSPSPGSGTITGDLGYPSEFIPPLTVYAIDIDDPRVFFSVETPKYPLESGPTPAQPTYELKGVAPGTYYVLGYRNDDVPNKDRPGVYSQFVVCGSGPTCTDHSLAPVTVRADGTVRDIDVTDWYYPPEQQYPPRPE